MHGLQRATLKALSRGLAWLAARLAAAAEPPTPPVTPETRRRPAQVLVVDNDIVDQRTAIAVLASIELRATVAGSGEEALAMLRGLRFDLILMDCDMPVMDGPDTARAIRAGKAGTENIDIPILGMIAATSQNGPHGLVAGMNQILSKPLIAEQLTPLLAGNLPGYAAAPVADAEQEEIEEALPEPAPQTEEAPAKPAGKPTPPGRKPPPSPPAPAPTATQAPVFDAKAMLDGFGDDQSFARQIVVATRSELPKRLGQMEKAMVAADWEKVQNLAGILESQAIQIGGLRLAARMAKIETGVRAGEYINAQTMTELKQAVGELDAALLAYLDTAAP